MNIKQQISSFWQLVIVKSTTYKFVIVAVVLLSIIASLQSLYSGSRQYHEGGKHYNKYNNYTIFEKSHEHLLDGKDIYKSYPDEHWDLFKYTPTFSAIFGILAICPDWLGLHLWNLINALIFIAGVYYLPGLGLKEKGLIGLLCMVELMTSMQSEQSNPMIAGLLMLSFGFFQRQKGFWATLCISVTVFIKLFGIIGFMLLLFYNRKSYNIIYSVFWLIILALFPLLFVSTSQYIFLMSSYWKMLSTDHSASLGFSLMGWLYTWFGVSINKVIFTFVGFILLILPLLKLKHLNNQIFQRYFLSSMLIWLVIFNHKAESPTFIIAFSGIALWFVSGNQSVTNKILLVLSVLFTALAPTDLYPPFVREKIFVPYVVKVFPCILIWLKINLDLYFMPNHVQTDQNQILSK